MGISLKQEYLNTTFKVIQPVCFLHLLVVEKACDVLAIFNDSFLFTVRLDKLQKNYNNVYCENTRM